ncbi:MAG TPA: transposase [Candidatus Acidoferrum sp.]|nr:transposase [Candidatus Acidoferrum sp.]
MFIHKSIRLPEDRYRSSEWYFITFCCEGRQTVFLQKARAEWLLKNIQATSIAHAIAVHAYCIMPDHVHLLLQRRDPLSDVLKFLKLLKQRTGYEYKQETGRGLWQKKSYDRILREGDSPDAVAWYIWMNPVRRGFCNKPGEYVFSGSLTGQGPSSQPPTQSWLPPWKRPT